MGKTSRLRETLTTGSSEHGCQPCKVTPVKSKQDFREPVRAILGSLSFREDFPTSFLWRKLDHWQQYLFVFEKARSFYVKSVHPVVFGKLQTDWIKMSGAD